MKHYVFKFAGNTNFAYLRIGMSCSEQLLSNLLKERHLFTVHNLILITYGEKNGRVYHR